MTLTFSRFEPASWFSAIGALKKRAQIEKRGLPELKDARFITLTLDRNRFPDAEFGYDCGNERLRKMAHKLRKAWGFFEYAAKMEFHADAPEWVHWHLIVPIYTKIDLPALWSAWGLGRVDCRRIRGSDLDYVFKYAAKSMSDLPQWALARERIRFWSTSQNFHTLPAEPRKKKTAAVPPALEKRASSTLGERLIKSARSGIFHISSESNGDFRWKLTDIDFGAILRQVCISRALGHHTCHVSERKITAGNRKDVTWLLIQIKQIQHLPNCLNRILWKSAGSSCKIAR